MFPAYLQGMESFAVYAKDIMGVPRSQPTYKGWKVDREEMEEAPDPSSQPTYKGWKGKAG